MSQIILDFILSAGTDNGYGYFHEKPEAAKFAKGISKNQKNKYIRYGKVPKPFVDYLEATEARNPIEGEYLRLDLIKETCPGVNENPIDSAEKLYKLIEENLKLHGCKLLRY